MLSNLNSNHALTLGYLNPALNNSALEEHLHAVYRFNFEVRLTAGSPRRTARGTGRLKPK